jgi:hypothetical protein
VTEELLSCRGQACGVVAGLQRVCFLVNQAILRWKEVFSFVVEVVMVLVMELVS